MANRKELRYYRRRAEEAAALAASVRALPRHVGDRVVWPNGVVWERVGDDRWSALGDGHSREHPYSSGHVASFAWTPYEEA